jgi:ABC-type transport system substrate-binding protein
MWLDERHVTPEEVRKAQEIPVSGTIDRTTIAKNIRIGKKTSAQAGWHQGGATPFGYRRRFDPVEGRAVLVKDSKEASIVAEIFRAYVKTASLEKARILLHDAGLRNSDGKGWSRSSLAFLLSNETYTGIVKYGGEGHVGRHEAIVSGELFEAAKQIRTKKYKRRR